MNLVVRDLQTNTSRALTDLAPISTPGWKWHGEAEFSTISKDGTQVAYGWLTPPDASPEIRVLPLHAPAGTSPRILVSGLTNVRYISALDWAPDGQWIAVSTRLADRTNQIALVNSRDGQMRVMKSVGWRGPWRVLFSPDGRSIAYDLPANDDTDQRDVFVMSVDASVERRIAAHDAEDRLVGWAPDGRLLFLSDRSGDDALWAQSFTDGSPSGSPVLLDPDVEGTSLGMTSSGSLVMFRSINTVETRRVALDPSASVLMGPALTFTSGRIGGASIPEWSPDGRYLASIQTDVEGTAILVRSLETGEGMKQIRGLYGPQPRWSPDGRLLVMGARDTRGREGLFQVDVASEAISLLVGGTILSAFPQFSPDGAKLYYRQQGERIVERDLSSGHERDVYTNPGLVAFEVSPDGRSLAVRVARPQEAPNVMIVPVAGGEAREILPPTRGPSGLIQGSMSWLPDGRALLVSKAVGDSTELWRVSVDGADARKIETRGDGWAEDFAPNRRFSVSRDGRTVAYVSGTQTVEVWAFDNVVPPAR
jgi:Tol biopolymer transport system component